MESVQSLSLERARSTSSSGIESTSTIEPRSRSATLSSRIDDEVSSVTSGLKRRRRSSTSTAEACSRSANPDLIGDEELRRQKCRRQTSPSPVDLFERDSLTWEVDYQGFEGSIEDISDVIFGVAIMINIFLSLQASTAQPAAWNPLADSRRPLHISSSILEWQHHCEFDSEAQLPTTIDTSILSPNLRGLQNLYLASLVTKTLNPFHPNNNSIAPHLLSPQKISHLQALSLGALKSQSLDGLDLIRSNIEDIVHFFSTPDGGLWSELRDLDRHYSNMHTFCHQMNKTVFNALPSIRDDLITASSSREPWSRMQARYNFVRTQTLAFRALAKSHVATVWQLTLAVENLISSIILGPNSSAETYHRFGDVDMGRRIRRTVERIREEELRYVWDFLLIEPEWYCNDSCLRLEAAWANN